MSEPSCKNCICTCCGKEYTGSTEDPELCMACWLEQHTKEDIDEILKDVDCCEKIVGAGGWDFTRMPNSICSMTRADVLDYLANCPKTRPIWFAVGHNSASPNGCGIAIPRSFQAYHMSKGWSDIGYHWVIDTCGTIFLGRNLVYQGAHAFAEGNRGSMGFCMVGDFSGGGGLPSPSQIDSAKFLVKAHENTFGYGCDSEYGHRWVVYPEHATSCPGTNIVSLNQYRQMVCGGSTPIPPPKREDNDMLVPFEYIGVEASGADKGLHVFVASEGFCEIATWKADCWLLCKNESDKTAKIKIYTTPFHSVKVDYEIPPKSNENSRFTINMANFKPTDGFATTVKSNVKEIVPQISMLVTKK